MKIDFANLTLAHQEYATEINVAIQKTIEKSHFIMGDEVELLEDELKNFTGSNHVITCSSGTSALLLALSAIGIGTNDEVITSPFSFIAAAEMIAFLGAKPVFVDIDPLTYQINPSLITSAITPKTKAIIPVSLFGQPSDMDSINKIAQKHNLIVIEDGAQSFGATYKEKKSCNLTPIATTSFFPAKPLGCYGDGGAVFCNDEHIATKIKSLRIHGQTKRYEHSYIGLGARLDTIQAAILRVKLKYYPIKISKRNQVAKLYEKYLKNKSVKLPIIGDHIQSVYAQYSILSADRNSLEKKLKQNNIPYAIHYPIALHLQPCFSYLGYQEGDFPIAEKTCKQILSLPMNPYLSENEIEYISGVID
ncbi:DegT/DnrJ/EryC1/StrS family aminotransferase [Helicobacter cappadocius]|uniref:DegT/DnrJ/EryC1/StrS family aminotransferase n=1 Tax=Helicobacter cappadocius TaxID=3063998 RepID=A0AA90TBD2_9HELI|nr:MULTISPECIES: DegT/DnrJ/EryC1/StrS family aminotransferase [unclassified Helicobacter]MDO7253806.1 DegT/DnrJ/EryC1/StrS family aminotransferase [Helicobacter sp. faydin-H75]MDP2538686.1 DegT/DnrJ/EryC1/StrS family aminotransferase [Helicobacter sp. faydin-H76]